jgi:hypothetical protein
VRRGAALLRRARAAAARRARTLRRQRAALPACLLTRRPLICASRRAQTFQCCTKPNAEAIFDFNGEKLDVPEDAKALFKGFTIGKLKLTHNMARRHTRRRLHLRVLRCPVARARCSAARARRCVHALPRGDGGSHARAARGKARAWRRGATSAQAAPCAGLLSARLALAPRLLSAAPTPRLAPRLARGSSASAAHATQRPPRRQQRRARCVRPSAAVQTRGAATD